MRRSRTLEADGAEPAPCPLPGCLLAGRAARGGQRRRRRERARARDGRGGAVRADRARRRGPRRVVVDLAAGRGTKTAELQALAVARGGTARLVALDVHGFKADLLRERMATLGVPDVVALTGDACDLASVAGMPRFGDADAVLLDAPCSGLGTLRRHPEKRWRVTREHVSELAALQARMLAEASRLVRPGGVVVYSTCSVLREENEDVVAGVPRRRARCRLPRRQRGARGARRVGGLHHRRGVLPVAAVQRRARRALRGRARARIGTRRRQPPLERGRGGAPARAPGSRRSMRTTRIVEMLEVTEAAALAAGRWMGKGDKNRADQAAVEAMREALRQARHRRRDRHRRGRARRGAHALHRREGRPRGGEQIDIAVDPLEGTNLTAYGQPNSLAVLAFGPKGTLLNAPDTYMMKVATGPLGGRLHPRRRHARPRTAAASPRHSTAPSRTSSCASSSASAMRT